MSAETWKHVPQLFQGIEPYEFYELMQKEHSKARLQNDVFHSMHEGYAVLLEEVEELKEQVFKKPHKRDNAAIIKECVQIATMAYCFAAECCKREESNDN